MITINSDANTPQPTELTEELVQIQHDNEAMDGSMQRDRKGQKKQATLKWGSLKPSELQLLIGYFTAGTTVAYNNSQSAYTGSTLAYTGLPTITEPAYLRGATLLKPLVVIIREA